MNPITTLPASVLTKLITRNPAAASALSDIARLAPRFTPPCLFEGDEGGPKGYHLCEHEDEPLGMWVCKCNGCGPKCTKYQALDIYGPIPQRHLIYHILPVSNGIWETGVQRLKQSWSLFNGRKIVAVMTGEPIREQADNSEGIRHMPRVLPLDSPSKVRSQLPSDCEVIEIPNDPTKWELVSWPILWDMILKTAGPTDAILYAHAKGVTRRPGSPCHMWASVMYDLALDYWPRVETLLKRFLLAGSFVKPGRHFGPPMNHSTWHYHGNFWWARAAAVKQRLAVIPMPVDRWATEAWVGTAYHINDAGEIFGPHNKNFFLYNPVHLNRALAEYRHWLETNKPTKYPFTTPLPVL